MLAKTLLASLCISLAACTAPKAPVPPAQAVGAAQSSQCPTLWPNGAAPAVSNTKVAVRLREVCFSGFVVLHSGMTHTPLLTSEHLASHEPLTRTNRFHEEARLLTEDRATLEDYRGSGFDRGHLTPAGDAATSEQMAQSFSLANIAPQAPRLNRGAWSHLEAAVRRMGDVWVMTGTLFEGAALHTVGRVMVPTAFWKAVRTGDGTWICRIAANEDAAKVEKVDCAALERRSGFAFMER
ncbi:DNA/RNA non-specific endonuclease [Caballeronia sp. LZ033]|uniref:DNA/RNA non-specific endonuclease n=1 Tax=Caballeronia sp. LZ033 TaxID=3038566 RepID=UPI00286752FA|nr:DNA/RNA non-specific endonuclease [Caballeronia sp. LZ033]MDR5813062.1 DNA/RNA non-specific endonuclease [Caballeronia sp. LZ033]